MEPFQLSGKIVAQAGPVVALEVGFKQLNIAGIETGAGWEGTLEANVDGGEHV